MIEYSQSRNRHPIGRHVISFLIHAVLWAIALIACPRDWRYPQTWHFVRNGRRGTVTLRRICNWLGHEVSATEYGYDGSEFEDRWCRWCDQLLKVPKGKFAFEVMAGRYGVPIGQECEFEGTEETDARR